MIPDFLRSFSIGKSSNDEFDKDEEKFDSPLEKKVNDKLSKDNINTWDEDEVESQYIGSQVVTNNEYSVPNPLTIRAKIRHYRWMAQNFYIDDAITKVKNEAIIEENGKIVSLNLDDVDFSESIKEKMHEEWKNTLRVIKFNKNIEKKFETFYRDGRSYHRMLFSDSLKDGVIGLQELDSLFIEKYKDKEQAKTLYKYVDIEAKNYIISENAIIALNSGKTNPEKTLYVSFLERSIKPLNILTLMTDALAIYRITRAPERRVFNISTGRRVHKKAKKYVDSVISNLKSNLSFNSSTGKMSQSYKALTMIEDYYFPKGNDETGTTVDTLRGGSQLGEIEDIQFLERQLLKSLMIPLSRSDSDSTMGSVFGNNVGDIEKEENDFFKLITYCRKQFLPFMLVPYRLNLILKGIITIDDWDKICDDIKVKWESNSHIAEMKFNEKIAARTDTVDGLADYIGIDFSRAWVRKNIWKFTDEEIEAMDKEIEQEAKDAPDDSEDDE